MQCAGMPIFPLLCQSFSLKNLFGSCEPWEKSGLVQHQPAWTTCKLAHSLSELPSHPDRAFPSCFSLIPHLPNQGRARRPFCTIWLPKNSFELRLPHAHTFVRVKFVRRGLHAPLTF